jgi:hypothetical protein
MQCIFCNGERGDLKILTYDAFNSICQVSIARQDGLHERIQLQYLPEYRMHRICRAKYINKRDIARCVDRLHNVGIRVSSVDLADHVVDDLDVQLSESKFDIRTCCLLCDESVSKVPKHYVSTMGPKSLDRLFYLCKSEVGQFSELLARLSDPVIFNAKFHRKCYLNFTRKHSTTRCASPDSSFNSAIVGTNKFNPSVFETDTSDIVQDADVLGTHFNVGVDAYSTLVEHMDVSESAHYDFNDHNLLVNHMDIAQTVQFPENDSTSISCCHDSTAIHLRTSIEYMDTCDIVTPDQHDGCVQEQDGIEMHSCRQCASCWRCDVGSGELDIQNYNGTLVLRRYSRVRAADINVDILLCGSCRTFLVPNLSVSKMWSSGWPCVITAILTDRQFAFCKSELWKLLPTSFMQWWHVVAASENLDCTDCGMFADMSSSRCRFDQLTKTDNIGDFISAMDDYAFPCVRCPAGCFADVYKCNLMTFNHFIDWKFNVSFFGGDKLMLNGARRDWPCPSVQLEEFSVRPSLIIDPQVGLSLMFCDVHGTGLKKPFVHVAKNPILKDHGLQYPDNLAAAILTPLVIRDGRMSKWTSSTHVIKAVGGYSGISSSVLSCDIKRTVCDERLAMAQCMAMKFRPDIYHISRERYIDDVSRGGEGEFLRVMNHYDSFYRHLVGLRSESAISGATFIDVDDCFRIHDQMFERDAKNDVDANFWKLSLLFPHSSGNHM